MVENAGGIEALLQEDRTFPPPPEFARQANISDPEVYARAAKDPEGFWAGFAAELDWFKPWDKTLEWQPPYAQWFVGGQLNAAYNCIDRHLATARRNKAAIIWEGEPGDWQVYTYRDLYREVCRFANGLKSLGVQKGDRVTNLPADGAGAANRDAGLRPDWGGAQRHIWRVQRGVDPGPHRRFPVQGDDYRRRGLSPRQYRPAETER